MLSGLSTTYLYGQTNDTPFVLHTTKKIDSKGTSSSMKKERECVRELSV